MEPLLRGYMKEVSGIEGGLETALSCSLGAKCL